MSKSFNSTDIPNWVLAGIEEAFIEWQDMSGEWLKTAPEYLLTVKVAQKIKDEIPLSRRTLLMEPNVARTLVEAGGIQRGPNAKKLRSNGRFDIVLGHGDGRPRTVIELKNPLWSPKAASSTSDLIRIGKALLQGHKNTQLFSGIFAFYTSSTQPQRKDASASHKLLRKWQKEWEPWLRSFSWAGNDQRRFEKHLRINVQLRIHEVKFANELHAWAAVCVQIRRKPKSSKEGMQVSE